MSPKIGSCLADPGSPRILHPSFRLWLRTAGIVDTAMALGPGSGLIRWRPWVFPDRSTLIPHVVALPAERPAFKGSPRGGGVLQDGRY